MEEWTSCPYNSTHKMPKSRFQWHIIKCPDKKRVGDQYSACPFNAQHIILKSEMTNHKMKCPDRDQREMISGQSDDIDRRIKEYLANQGQNKQSIQGSTEWGSASWDTASDLPVGETLDEKYVYPFKFAHSRPSTKTKKKESNSNNNPLSFKDNNNHTQESTNRSPSANGVKPSKDSSKIAEPATKTSAQPTEQPEDPSKVFQRQMKNVTKKLSQIREIEQKQQQGQALNADQMEKLKRKTELEQELKNLTAMQEN